MTQDRRGAVEALADRIWALIGDWDDPPSVEPAVFGTADPRAIAAQVEAFCATRFGAGIGRPLFYQSSVGAAFGLVLTDGRRVVVKAHQAGVAPEYLRAVQTVTRHLAGAGFPCPAPLLAPTPLGHGLATAEACVDDGECCDPHQPWVRRAMAETLARQLLLARDFIALTGLTAGLAAGDLPPAVLWPTPHSALFDFVATATGAEWIDEIAWRARRLLAAPAGEPAVGHCDWSGKHFRFVAGQVRMIYDWDSLRVAAEPVIVGRAAHAFTAMYDTPWEGKVPTAPSFEEVLAFIAEYEVARGAPFTAAERRTCGAACAYSLAYSARCSHAGDPRPGQDELFPPGTWRASLVAFGQQLLDL